MKSNIIATALITGSSRRLGAAIATYLHTQAYNVVIHYHQHRAAAEALCQSLNATRNHSAIALHADLTNPAAIPHLIEQSLAAWGQLNVLVNNAAVFYPTPFSTATLNDWQTLMDSNLRAPYWVSQAAQAALTQQQGTMINIADIHGLKPLRNHSIYSISKAGLIMLTQALAQALAPAVRVNAIATGPCLWPEGSAQLTAAQQAKLIDKTLLKRVTRVTDITTTVGWLIDNQSITGQTITLDAGRRLD